jgi:hypothetical protein
VPQTKEAHQANYSDYKCFKVVFAIKSVGNDYLCLCYVNEGQHQSGIQQKFHARARVTALQIRVAPHDEIHVTDFGGFDGAARLG